MGTYNYCGPSDSGGHYTYDVAPWYEWGNTESQGIERSLLEGMTIENGRAADNLARYLINENARIQHDYYLRLINGN
jgi:hypothetical protein